jgi:hypothetical protein
LCTTNYMCIAFTDVQNFKTPKQGLSPSRI